MSSAEKLIALLTQSNRKLVLAESCTCGMTVAMLGGVPGASNVLCGSLVTYREDSKTKWLGVPAQLISQHTAESQPVTDAMAVAAVAHTPEADFGAAITGHLGPNAPEPKDGLVMLSLADRSGALVATATMRLQQTERRERQLEAAERFIQWVFLSLEN